MLKTTSLMIVLLGACAVETGTDAELDLSETAGIDTDVSETTGTDTDLSEGTETSREYEYEPCVYDQSCEPPPCPYELDCEPPPEPVPACPEAEQLDLAPANVDNNDGRVTFCHATSSATNPFVVITTSVSACRAHVEHEHQEQGGHFDVFPTGGCED